MENLKDGYISDYVSGLQVRITPEEIEAVQPFLHKLVDDYGYPKENIVTHPQYRVKARPSDVKKEYPVDIAVFADSKHKDDDCYLIVECKKKKRRDGKEQLEDYLRFSKASLGVWYNGKETLYLRKYEQGGYVKFIEIPNIPIYGQRVEDVGLFRRCDLKKTHNLKSVFGSIRNYLAANNTGISEYNLVTIAELVDQGLISISNGDEVGKLAYGTGNIPFIRTSDIANWEIKLDPKQGLSKDIYDSLRDKQDVQACDILMVKDGTYLVGTCAMVTELETKIVYQSHLWKIRSLDHDKLNPYLLLALLSSPIVKQQIRAKQFTQDIIDTIGKRINELVLPFPKDKNQEARIIEKVQRVFEKRTEAKSIMREILLNVTPVHDYDNENPFLTLL